MATSASKAKPGAQPEAAAAQASGNRGKPFIILTIVLLLIAAGGGAAAWYYLARAGAGAGTHHAQEKSKPKSTAPPVFLPLETFTVNLQTEDTTQQQFLQLNMTLQAADDAQVDMIKLNMPQVRNRLLMLLSSKKAAEILSVEGKQKLAEEILKQVQQPFVPQGPQPEVSGVFFTSFVVQ